MTEKGKIIWKEDLNIFLTEAESHQVYVHRYRRIRHVNYALFYLVWKPQ